MFHAATGATHLGAALPRYDCRDGHPDYFI